MSTTSELTIKDYHIHAVIDDDGDLNLYVRHTSGTQLKSTDSEADCHDNEVAFRVLNPAIKAPAINLATVSKKFPSLEFLGDSIVFCKESQSIGPDPLDLIEVEFQLSDQGEISFTTEEYDRKSSGTIDSADDLKTIEEAITLCEATLQNEEHKADKNYYKSLTKVINRAIKTARHNHTRITNYLANHQP